MTLKCIDLSYATVPVPSEITDFLRAIDDVVQQNRVDTALDFRGFVPCDYVVLYQCLKAVYDSNLLCGHRFCEWGSGVSVVASLAALVGYESYGIEYDRKLCQAAEGIRDRFDVPVTLVHGSFVPDGVDDLIDNAFASHNGELALRTDPDHAYDEMGYDVDDFDLIFTFPWPNDVELTQEIFDRCAAQGAMLLAYFCEDAIGLYRKA